MEVPGFTCQHTGRCCREHRIPVTLTDIARIAEELGVPAQEVFERKVWFDDTHDEAHFLLRKTPKGDCIFNTEDLRCSVHPGKPDACALYICDVDLKSEENYPWPLVFDHGDGQALIIGNAAAKEVTKEYLAEHAGAWHAEDFEKGVAEINARTEGYKSKTFRAQRTPENNARFISFDCPACEARSSCCKDRPLTLADVQTLAAHHDIDIAESWERFVAEDIPEKAQGLLSLRHGEHGACMFLDAASNRCTAPQDALPAPCRFIACPLIATEAADAERYFAGAGTVEEQYRHSIAEVVSRHYVGLHGATYHAAPVEAALAWVAQLCDDETQFAAFKEAMAGYRY